MPSRIPLPYSSKVLDHFRNPRNLGAMEDATVSAMAGSPACGDMIAIYLKIRKKKGEWIIERASFESYGCAANIASASVLTVLIMGKTLKEAWNITWKRISDELGGLPAIKMHCGVLAVGALKRAIRKFFGEEKPEWLPEGLTSDERMALEEEELIERMYSRFSETLGKRR